MRVDRYPVQGRRACRVAPVFTGCREDQFVKYLDTHADAGAKLTPVLPSEFLELASEYGNYDWHCVGCGSSFAWDMVDIEDADDSPVCPVCIENTDFVTLSGPVPDEQLLLEL